MEDFPNWELQETVRKEASLTKKELEILLLLCQGLRDKEIARQLCKESCTVSSQLRPIYKKLGVHNRIQAVVWAIKKGIA